MTERLPSDIAMDKLNIVAAAAPVPLSDNLVLYFWRGFAMSACDSAMVAGVEADAAALYSSDQFAAFQAAIAACDYKDAFGSAEKVSAWIAGGGLRGRRAAMDAAALPA